MKKIETSLSKFFKFLKNSEIHFQVKIKKFMVKH